MAYRKVPGSRGARVSAGTFDDMAARYCRTPHSDATSFGASPHQPPRGTSTRSGKLLGFVLADSPLATLLTLQRATAATGGVMRLLKSCTARLPQTLSALSAG
jgi:hypothetical protein